MNNKSGVLLLLLLLFCQVVVPQAAGAQDVAVKGIVLDATGESVIGASVLVKGTTNGTVTDVSGAFSLLKVPVKSVLVISYIGYATQEVVVSGEVSLIKVVLKEDSKSLDELVVIGYGTQKKSSLTSSVETIKREDLLSIPTPNLDEALTGQVSGMHVRTLSGDPSSPKEADIRIRGIQGSPLLVIDGIPRFGNNTSDGEMRLSDLNPDDIESISILKDAAAAAVYGARAANGVILVQTKRGSADQKVKINYRGQFNLTQATQLPEFLGAYDFALLRNKAINGTPGTTLKAYTDAEMEMIRTQSNKNRFSDENLLDYLTPFGYTTTHSLSVSGGSQLVRYYVSGGYTNSKGLYGGVGRDRYNYAVKLDATLAKGLVMKIDVTGTRSDNKNTSYSTLDAAYSSSPVQPLRFTNGQLASVGSANPLINVEGLGGHVRNQMSFNTITAMLNYDVAKVKGLSFYAKATMDDNIQTVKTFSSPTTLYTYEPTYDDEGNEVAGFKEDLNTVYPKAKITLEERDQVVKNYLLEAGANYSRTFAEKHAVTGLLVVNYQDYQNRYLMAKNENLPGAFPESIGSGASGKIGGSESMSQRASVIGRLTYGYNNRYFIESSFRMDASTRFHPDYRWGLFPTASASWVVSNEPFFRQWNQDVLSNTKLRASTGVLGRDGGIGDFSYLMNYIYNIGNNGYQFGDSYRPGIIPDPSNGFPNPDLKMEKSQDYNVALDLGFWDNRFGLTFEHYWRYRTDMITMAPYYLFPPSTGIDDNLPSVNFGRIKAWGWDLTLNHKNSIGKFKYDVTFIASRTNDVVLDYGDESSVPASQRRRGRRSTLLLAYESAGLFQSQEEIDALEYDQDGLGNISLAPGDIKYIDRNDDGIISGDDRLMVRNSSQPDLALGLNLNVSYKGFFVGARFQGTLGYIQQVNDIYSLETSSMQRYQKYHLTDSWSPDNRDARYPRLKVATSTDNNRKVSTFWLRETNFMRLKSLSVGYSLPSAALRNMKIASLSVSLQGGNLFTLSTLKEMDPETLRGYPVQRTYGISLNVGF